MKLDQPNEPEPAKAANPHEKPMSFWGHLEDLRWTLVKSAAAFLICAIFIGIFLRQFNDVILWPLHSVKAGNPNLEIDLGTTSIMEGFTVVIQICGIGGFIMALPFILFFTGQFVAPALTEKEMRLVLPVCLSAFLLFVFGCAFSFFFLVPSTLKVSVQLNDLFGYVMRWTPASYYSLLLWLVLGVGASFEFPLVIVVLVWLGLMSTAFLKKYRRHAIVAIFIIAAVVTPTPDPVTQSIFALPLYLLFELAVFVGGRVERARLASAS